MEKSHISQTRQVSNWSYFKILKRRIPSNLWNSPFSLHHFFFSIFPYNYLDFNQFLKSSCSLWCKDTNFSANHNRQRCHWQMEGVVLYDAKILIFQQITTRTRQEDRPWRCSLWCKDTNFSANHNSSSYAFLAACVVLYDAKILIFQQITTHMTEHQRQQRLFFMMQRY